MSGGYVWTVGQSGLSTTNQNLCDLVNSLSPWAIGGCRVQLWIAWLWCVLAAAAAIYLLGAAFMSIRRSLRARRRTTAVIPSAAPTITANGAAELVAFSFAWASDGSQSAKLIISPTRPLGEVVVMARFALPFHYVSESNWRWTLPQQMAERDGLLAGETIEVLYFERNSDERTDNIKVFGRSAPLKWKDPEQGEMLRIEVTVHANEGRASFDRIWQFRRARARRFIDCLQPTGLDYPADDRLLVL